MQNTQIVSLANAGAIFAGWKMGMPNAVLWMVTAATVAYIVKEGALAIVKVLKGDA
jgi:hypothetical protein